MKPISKGRVLCAFCGHSIPLNSQKVLVEHNILYPEGISRCPGSSRRVTKGEVE